MESLRMCIDLDGAIIVPSAAAGIPRGDGCREQGIIMTPSYSIRNQSLKKPIIFWILLALILNHCSILRPKKTVYDPLIDFYEMEPSEHTKAALNLTQQARDQINKHHDALAIENLNRALSIDAYNPFSYYFLGLIYYRKREHKKSLAFLRKANQLSQEFPFWKAQAHFLSGLNWKALGETTKAQFHLKQAKTIAPDIDFPP